MSRQILFLDFDGTLHPYGLSALRENGTIDFRSPPLFQWLPVLADLLAPYPRVEIVVSSDWRFHASEAEICEWLGPLGSRYSGVTTERHISGRVRQIECWIEDNLFKRDRFLVLDDDPEVEDMASEPVIAGREWVWCNPRSGISTKRVQARIARWLEGGKCR